MEKPYDIKALGDELKSQGLELAEDAVETIYDGLMNWLEASAKASKTPFDDFVILMRGQIDGYVKPKIDNINPNDNVPE